MVFLSPAVQTLTVKLSQKERNPAAVEARAVGKQAEGALSKFRRMECLLLFWTQDKYLQKLVHSAHLDQAIPVH